MRCITRTLKPSSGEVWLDDTNFVCAPEGETAARPAHVAAMVWQQASLVRRSSVLTNVASGALGRYSTLRTVFAGLPTLELDAARGNLAEVGLAALADQQSCAFCKTWRSPNNWRCCACCIRSSLPTPMRTYLSEAA